MTFGEYREDMSLQNCLETYAFARLGIHSVPWKTPS